MGKSKKIKCLIMIIMAIIGIIAAGFFLWKTGRVFIQMVSEGSADNAATTRETQEEILILSKIEFWTCQTGVYKNRENAAAAVTELGSKGWKASIINDENFIVSVGMTATKEEGAEVNKKLEQGGINGWLKKVEYPSLHFKVTGKEVDTTIKVLKLANVVLTTKDINDTEASKYIDILSVDKCPDDLRKIKEIMLELYKDQNPEGQPQKIKPDSRKLFELFNEYRSITIKYFSNDGK